MFNALTNVRFGGKADSDQPLLTNLDLWVHGRVSRLRQPRGWSAV